MYERILSFDRWKGIAILCVILIHSIGYTITPYSDVNTTYYAGIVRQFLNIAVPVFLFISGYLSSDNSESSFLTTIYKRSKRIIIPYLTWAIIYTIYRYISGATVTPLFVLKGLLTGTIIDVGYFVIVIMQFVVLSVFISKIASSRSHVILIILLSIAGLTFTYYNQIIFTSSPFNAFPLSAIPFIVWYPFFHMGFYLSKYNPENIKISIIKILLPIALIISIAEGLFFISNKNYAFGVSQLKFTSFFASAIVCLYIYASRSTEKNNHWLVKIGVYSYGLYLSHILIMKMIIKLSSTEGIYFTHPVMGTIYIFTCTSILSFILCHLISLLPPRVKSFFIG